jgi:hypothetical protein
MEDWRLLIELKDILEPIYHQTMRTQGWAKNGSHGSLWEILTGMEFLMEKMEDWKAFFDNPAIAATSAFTDFLTKPTKATFSISSFAGPA